MRWNHELLRIAIIALLTGCNWAVIDGVEGGPDGGSGTCGEGGAQEVSGGGQGGATLETDGGAMPAPSGSRTGCGGAGGVGGQGGASAE